MRSSTWPYCAKRSAKPVFTLYYHLQVAEFELNASTLRTNSSAMTFSKNLVTKSMSDIFIVLQDFRPRSRPDIPEQAEKRMGKWARRMEGVWNREDTWEAVKHRLGWRSWEALRKQEVERGRMQRLAETRVDAWEEARAKEKDVTQSSMRWDVPTPWHNVDCMWGRDTQLVDSEARDQLRKLGVIKGVRDMQMVRETLPIWVGNVQTELWGGGWLTKANEKYKWMEKDQAEYPDEWEEDWPRMHLWWDDVREWTERWRWRNDVIEEFEKTTVNLLLELEKIDGSASAREFNVFSAASETTYDAERCHHLTDHIANMKIALVAGDETWFVRNCTSALGLIGGVLRSKGVKQGAYYSAICELHTINAKYYNTRS